MRVLGFLIWIVLASSLTFASAPAQLPLVSETDKGDCCARMRMQTSDYECERHTPKPEPDKQCCALCAFGLAILASATTPFVYAPVGDETFAAYISSEHRRSQRPPVPPPRA